MGVLGHILIGERINYSIPKVGRLLDSGDYHGLQKIAMDQAGNGADYVDVNVGPLPIAVMEGAVRAIQEVTNVPLCLDSTDPAILEAGIGCYDQGRSRGLPILNSAIESNADRVFRLRQNRDCQVVLLVSERMDGSSLCLNVSSDESHGTARRLFAKASEHGFRPDEIYIDPGTPALSGDLTGLVNIALDTMDMIRLDPDLAGCHILVGLTNLTAGLPRRVRLPLQNAFLTLATGKGLDSLIGDPSRQYALLDPENPHLVWLTRILSCESTERLTELTASELYREAVAREGTGQQS